MDLAGNSKFYSVRLGDPRYFVRSFFLPLVACLYSLGFCSLRFCSLCFCLLSRCLFARVFAFVAFVSLSTCRRGEDENDWLARDCAFGTLQVWALSKQMQPPGVFEWLSKFEGQVKKEEIRDPPKSLTVFSARPWHAAFPAEEGSVFITSAEHAGYDATAREDMRRDCHAHFYLDGYHALADACVTPDGWCYTAERMREKAKEEEKFKFVPESLREEWKKSPAEDQLIVHKLTDPASIVAFVSERWNGYGHWNTSCPNTGILTDWLRPFPHRLTHKVIKVRTLIVENFSSYRPLGSGRPYGPLEVIEVATSLAA